MRLSESGWGTIYSFSAIFVFIISIWDFPIINENTHIVLLNYYNILVFILELIFGFLFIGLSVKSFIYARKGLDGKKSTSLLSKIFVWISNFYQVIMIEITINYILYW